MRLPLVAIVGRPNVGKSTLFNRLTGSRRALVDDTPGVTRDRLAAEVSVRGRSILLVDTAGLDADADSEIDAAVQEQARAAVEAADAILFVTDGQAGLVPQEHEIADLLRRTKRPVALAVNKIDAPRHAPRMLEFHALGLEPVRAISAEHGSGAWDVLEEIVAKLPPPAEQAPEAPLAERPLRVAIVGRPNVGKSSLLNQLAGETRVVVSSEGGTTRDAIDVSVERDGRSYVFVDTAGMRRAGRRDRLVERGSALMAVRAIEDADVALVLLDASEGFTDQDARVLMLVRERGRPCLLLANKWDRVGGEDAAKRARDGIERRLRPVSDVPVLEVSAKTGKNTGRILPLAAKVAEAAAQEIPTSALNRWLQDAVRRHEPSMAQRGTRKRPIKFFYATQAGTRPPTFVLFCTEPREVLDSYRRFLENRLREDFGFAGVPVRLRLRKRHAERET
ncbi:MAG: ribosome biogenesis GTPase Der [Deltaproteobacteria bacterium]|nr:ribosome biogenesis GTPase Der [Deltaproteobacteria bacterium]